MTRRLSCVIVDNMCKLIEHPKEILPFYSTLKSKLEYCNDTMSDPEARKVSNRALNTLKGCCSVSENTIFHKQSQEFFDLLSKYSNDENSINLEYLSVLITNMTNSNYFDKEKWNLIFSHYIRNDTENICNNVGRIRHYLVIDDSMTRVPGLRE